MNNGQYSASVCAVSRGRPLASATLVGWILGLRFAFIALAVVLAGCATRDLAPEEAPPVHVAESTWWQVDSDIGAASLAAKGTARSYAVAAMERWRERVYDLTEADFIPWFTGYWTQQRLAIKVAWYKLGGSDGVDPAMQQLARYLQAQYHERVLGPVAEEVNPDTVRVQATNLYVQRLGQSLRDLPLRHGVPLDPFEKRLAGIPAIALSASPDHNASLFQVVNVDSVTNLPAYAALLAYLRKEAGGEGTALSDARISPVAKRAGEKLATRIVASGGATAAAAAVGGVAGLVISLGAVGIGAIAHSNDQPEMAAQVRESLDAAADEMWLVLTEDPVVGVMAGVNHISAQVEGSVAASLSLPVTEGPPIGEAFLVDEPITPDEEVGNNKQGQQYDYDALEGFGVVDE